MTAVTVRMWTVQGTTSTRAASQLGEGESGPSGLDSVVGSDRPLAHIRSTSFVGQTSPELLRQQLVDEIPDSEEDSDDGEF